jgi:hypothetical protein
MLDLQNVDVVITGDNSYLQIKSSVNISCSSDLEVQTIRWLNNSDNGRELFRATRQQQLFLPIEMVTRLLTNTTYTCEIHVMLATVVSVVQMNVTLQVSGGKHYCGTVIAVAL